MNQEKIIVIDFGGQYNQLVARRVRECHVYCEIYSYRTPIEQIKAMNPKGIILTGGPNSVYEEGAATCSKELFEMGVPVLGLCYGAQLMSHVLGGHVCKAPVREYGKIEVTVDKTSKLFGDVSEKTICWMSHNDYIEKEAPGFRIVAHTPDCPVAAAECEEKKLYAIQFHPEVLHTQEGTKMLHNFIYEVCGCAGTWKMDAFVENSIKAIREKVGNGKVLCALSGGVDSSVAAVMLAKAVGDQLTCVFVDHGLLRKNEGDEVEEVFGPNGPYDLHFIRVNAQQRFYDKLAGVEEPERKRKIIGEEFIRVFKGHSAAKTVHHGFAGGLLEHTLSVVKMCRYFADTYEILNRDLLYTAAMCHDIGKTKELSAFPDNDYTDDGQLLGHIIIGVEMMNDAIREIPGFPEKLGSELKHCIISHHGELEYGSPKKPALAEAMALNLADNADAKMQTLTEIFKNKPGNDWLGYNRMFETNLRRSSI